MNDWTSIANQFGRVSPLAVSALGSITNDAMIEDGSLSTSMLGTSVSGQLRVAVPTISGAAVVIDGGTGQLYVYDGQNKRVVIGKI